MPPQYQTSSVDLPLRGKGEKPHPSTGASLQLHPLPSRDALLVKIQPPKEPAYETKHVPCDIVLVIDVSGSMGTRADVPGEDPSESAGLSVLDLVKHAALTIIETLDHRDRLGIVTFSSKSEVVQWLTPMTEDNKAQARRRIQRIHKENATNLWHGILDAIKVCNEGALSLSTKVPSIMILTDGRPNFMCPPAGYIPKLRSMLPLPAAISTFAFGYDIDSSLLKSIAEIGGGSYAFIPDAGMIGTVFVHAVANLQSTFAINAFLQLTYTHPMELCETTGETVDQQRPEEDGPYRHLRISLGNLQYGQSRDIFIQVKNIPQLVDQHDEKGQAAVTARLIYNVPGSRDLPPVRIPSNHEEDKEVIFTNPTLSATCSMLAESNLTASEVAYHESRSRICSFLSSLFPIQGNGNHQSIPDILLPDMADELNRLIDELPATRYSDDKNQSLVADLTGPEPQGQVSLAIGKSDYFHKWGVHYLPSLLNAHVSQACNTFKDPGPLQYGVDSPLFKTCRASLDMAFDSLPPPEPSLPAYSRNSHSGSGHHSAPISMARYHNPCGVCFAGATPVELASGNKVAIRKLRRGTKVQTPLGPRKVAMVLRTRVKEESLCLVGGVLVTPWHPMSADGKTWEFPAALNEGSVRYTGSIYSILLQRDSDTKAHGIRVGDMWGVTLGHGLVSGSDARAHSFFGDYNQVGKSLIGLGLRRNGLVAGKGVRRDERTGLVVGFKKE